LAQAESVKMAAGMRGRCMVLKPPARPVGQWTESQQTTCCSRPTLCRCLQGRHRRLLTLVVLILYLMHIDDEPLGRMKAAQASFLRLLHPLARPLARTVQRLPLALSAPALMVGIALSGLVCMPYTMWSLAVGQIYAQHLGRDMGVPLAMSVVAGGIWCGGILAFFLGRVVLRQTVLSYVARTEGAAPLFATVAQNPVVAVALAKLTPGVPAPLTNYGFGVTDVRLRDFAIGSVASVLWPLCCVVIGSGLQSMDEMQTALPASVSFTFSVTMLGVCGLLLLQRRLSLILQQLQSSAAVESAANEDTEMGVLRSI